MTVRPMILLAAGALLLAACSSVAAQTAPLSSAPGLDFNGAPDMVDGRNTAFARSVPKRYGEGRAITEIAADATAQGFECQDMMASSATPDDPVITCLKSDVKDACAQLWTIDILRGADLVRGRVEGRHVKRCMGALPG
jgi:hypothetical protein